MTRETKIGLLVGLAFIVVFAMLLSHTGTMPPAGDGLHLAKVRADAPPATGERLVEGRGGIASVAANSDATAASPTPSFVTQPEPTPGPMVELPKPREFDPPLGDPQREVTEPVAVTDEPPSAPTGTANALESVRVAPPLPIVVEPTATRRESLPTPSSPVEPAEDVQPAPLPTAPPQNAVAHEYTVRKGDTLFQIAKSVYGTASIRVQDFLFKSNKDRMKDRNFVVEGQKLVTPALPPELFEPVTNLSVAQSTERVANLTELINSAGTATSRRAPTVADAERKPEAPARQPKGRTYEIKSKETFSSIAKEELGSENLWKDIQKLNKDMDPNKLKPGTRINLPARKPVSVAAPSGRNSA